MHPFYNSSHLYTYVRTSVKILFCAADNQMNMAITDSCNVVEDIWVKDSLHCPSWCCCQKLACHPTSLYHCLSPAPVGVVHRHCNGVTARGCASLCDTIGFCICRHAMQGKSLCCTITKYSSESHDSIIICMHAGILYIPLNQTCTELLCTSLPGLGMSTAQL